MPEPTTSVEFLDLVRKSGLVSAARLDTFLQNWHPGDLPPLPRALAPSLIREGILTYFQTEQILLGKWRRFTIGSYLILERLGTGAMGLVYLCEHPESHERVAIKVLPPVFAKNPEMLKRFYREARAGGALDHENIVRVHDVDQDDKVHFMVMEFVDGSVLQDIVKNHGPLSALRAAHYIRQAAIGLQHAHEAGLIHRDIKPANLLLNRRGTVKMLDMGLARFADDEEDVLTKGILGTADYLAPEQTRDSHYVDIRADIYSLGGSFYFLLTGSPPFGEGTVAQKLVAHQTQEPKPIRTLRPEVPEALVALVATMMAKDPAQRFQTPAAVAEALAPWTQTPIPPPPEAEMLQLSPAALGNPPPLPTVAGPAKREASPVKNAGPPAKVENRAVLPSNPKWAPAAVPAAPKVTPSPKPAPDFPRSEPSHAPATTTSKGMTAPHVEKLSPQPARNRFRIQWISLSLAFLVAAGAFIWWTFFRVPK